MAAICGPISPAVPHDDVVLPGEAEPALPVIFQRLTPEVIKKLSRQMKGSSGPSGLDSDAWCRMTTCYREALDRLCCALAAAARCLCTETLEADAMIGFTSARLIPLDKKPGVRPIAVGEVCRRLICRAIMTVVESDVRRVTAPLPHCRRVWVCHLHARPRFTPCQPCLHAQWWKAF